MTQAPAAAGVVVEAAGWLTTVQDTGRWGYQRFGVPVAGAMDLTAHRRANRLVGNPASAATLEVTITGPVLRFESEVRLAVTGAAFDLRLDAYAVSPDTRLAIRPGQRLVFGRRIAGARAYVAAAGGFDVPVVFGSRSTHLASRMGGVDGRAIRAGDRLRIGRAAGAPRPEPAERRWRRTLPAGGARVRTLPGPHAGLFDPAAIDRLRTARYTIRPASDRMGYRLQGPPIIGPDGLTLLSQGLPVGAVQVLPSGDLIVAMADRQTTGGYPRPAVVITADVPQLAQLAPGDWIEFAPCDPRTARAAVLQGARELADG